MTNGVKNMFPKKPQTLNILSFMHCDQYFFGNTSLHPNCPYWSPTPIIPNRCLKPITILCPDKAGNYSDNFFFTPLMIIDQILLF